MLEVGPRHAHTDILRPGSLQLRARLRHLRLRAESSIEAVLRQVERFLVRDQCLIQKLLLRIGAAQLEIVDGQFGVQAQANGLHIARAGLGFFARSRN